MLKLNLKLFFSICLALFLISNQVLAVSISYPKPKEIMSDVEKRYGLDKDILRRAQQKEAAPIAEVYFDNTSPEEGEEVTASAFGLKFRNTSENLYYTWYILHTNEEGEYIDLSGNEIEEDEAIEKGKVEAMGMVARGNFDPVLFGVNYDIYDDDNDDDDDGFYAPFGGFDGVGGRSGDISGSDWGIGTYDADKPNFADYKRGLLDGNKITRCYRHNFGNAEGGVFDEDSGKDLIVECKHKFPRSPKGSVFTRRVEGEDTVTLTCDSNKEIGGDDKEFTVKEELCWRLNPESSDTDGDGFVDEADLAGLGQSSFTWKYQKGDRVGVVIEGTSLKAINEGPSAPTADEVSTGIIGYSQNEYFLGGGYVEKDPLVDALLLLYHKVASPEVKNLVKEVNLAGITKSMGVIDNAELAAAIDAGKDIEDLYYEFNNPDLNFVESDYTEVKGKIDTNEASNRIKNDFFRISQTTLNILISGQGAGFVTAVGEHLGDPTLSDPVIMQTLADQIFSAYSSNLLNQAKLDELLGVSLSYPGALSVDLVINYLDGSRMTADAIEEIFKESVVETVKVVNNKIETFLESKSTSNAYYKIMWGGIDICSDKNNSNKDGGLKNDECENNPSGFYDDYKDFDLSNNTEYGFNYLATKEVFEKNEENLETALGYFPEKAFFNKMSPELSTNITIFSSLKNKNIDSDFVYYDWEIYKCANMNDQTCTETGEWLTENCEEGDPLESCAMLDGKKIFSSESFAGGMGINNISFIPNIKKEGEDNISVLMGDEEKVYLKVALKTSELKSKKVKAVSTVMIEVVQKDFAIDFYKTFKDEDNYYDYDEKICTDESSSVICPVYPYQILAAKASIEDDVKILGYFWEIDGRRVYAPQNCGSGCDQILTGDSASLVYLPIMKATNNVQEVTLNIQLEEDGGIIKNLTASRSISIKNPFAVIRSNDTGLAWSKIKNADDYVNAFYTNPGNRVEFRADVVPYYLEKGKDGVELKWFINGEEVDDDFLSENPDLDVTMLDDKISFITPIDFNGMMLGARVTKAISSDQKKDFSDAWGFNIIKDSLEEYSSISIKPDLSDLDNEEETASMRIFMASTIKNAPEYLIFSLKLSIIIVLIWSALFGSSFFFESYDKYERN